MRLFFLFFVVLFLGGCFSSTRELTEKTQLNLVADTPIGPIKVTGDIDRTQTAQTQLNVEAPKVFKDIASSGVSYVSGLGGIGGLGYALYATIKRRKSAAEHLETVERKEKEHAEKMQHYLSEICQGISQYLAHSSDEDAKELRRCLKESTSRDTRTAVSEFSWS
jgi:hypothetical protein